MIPFARFCPLFFHLLGVHKMKQCLTVLLAASMLVAFVGIAQAENGMPSQSTLRAMGLSGMQVMSDREAMNVRGMGYSSHGSTAIAFGISYAHAGGYQASAGSLDGFFAKGNHFAGGAHGSIAGKVVITYGGGGGPPAPTTSSNPPLGTNGGGGGGGGGGIQVKAIVVFAGGFAVSSAY
jgi:hypothetical protein